MDLAKITRLARHRYHQVIADSNIEGVVVPIACYIDEDSYHKICDDALSFFEHWAFLAIFGEMAAKRGAVIVFVPLNPEDYFAWCEKYKFINNPQSRAKYVSQLLSGTIDGISSQIDDNFE